MSEYFSFSAELAINDLPERVIFIFKGIDGINELSLGTEFQKQLEAAEFPDHVVILVPEYWAEGIADRAKLVKSPIYTAIQRGSGKISSIVAAGYGIDGKIATVRKLKGDKTISKADINGCLSQIKAAGISTIASETSANSRAPYGFVFSKPSSRKSNYFIRAENLLSETGMVFFLAFCLLENIQIWKFETGKRLEAIYIDSMGISALAFALSTTITKLDELIEFPQVHSFHSYDGIYEKIPVIQQAFCIISASSSNGLAKAWQQYSACATNAIVTLLSFSDADKTHPVLHFIDKPEDYESFDEDDDGHGRTEVRIVGERFSFQPSKPKAIELVSDHAPANLEWILDKLAGEKLIRCRVKDGGKIRDLYIDAAHLSKMPDFEKWLSRCLGELAPISTRTIIYLNDPHSSAIKDQAVKYFRSLGVELDSIYSSDDIFQNAPQIQGSVLVVAGTIGNGTALLNISRRLRKLHPCGTRVYVCAALIGKSQSNNDSLKSNLRQPAKGARKHSFEVFIEASPGDEKEFWNEELRLLNRMLERAENDFLLSRRDTLNKIADGLIDDAFFYSSETSLPLQLNDGFAFCSEKFVCRKASPADIFFAVSWILQNARESKKFTNSGKVKPLASEDLQQAVLAPKNFSRFDDGIIQAALLRASLPSELDYRDSKELSIAMARILKGIITNHDKNRGEAAVDFLVALAIGKIRLTKHVKSNLVENLLKIHGLPEHMKLLISECAR